MNEYRYQVAVQMMDGFLSCHPASSYLEIMKPKEVIHETEEIHEAEDSGIDADGFTLHAKNIDAFPEEIL